MNSIKDLEQDKIEVLTNKAIEFAKVFNAYIDDRASISEVHSARSAVVFELLYCLGFEFEPRNEGSDHFYYRIDGKEVK